MNTSVSVYCTQWMEYIVRQGLYEYLLNEEVYCYDVCTLLVYIKEKNNENIKRS